eukprot:2817112-Rhodomonas_salina.1
MSDRARWQSQLALLSSASRTTGAVWLAPRRLHSSGVRTTSLSAGIVRFVSVMNSARLVSTSQETLADAARGKRTAVLFSISTLSRGWNTAGAGRGARRIGRNAVT